MNPKKWIKWINLIAVLTMAIAVFSACGGDDDGESSLPEDREATATATPGVTDVPDIDEFIEELVAVVAVGEYNKVDNVLVKYGVDEDDAKDVRDTVKAIARDKNIDSEALFEDLAADLEDALDGADVDEIMEIVLETIDDLDQSDYVLNPNPGDGGKDENDDPNTPALNGGNINGSGSCEALGSGGSIVTTQNTEFASDGAFIHIELWWDGLGYEFDSLLPPGRYAITRQGGVRGWEWHLGPNCSGAEALNKHVGPNIQRRLEQKAKNNGYVPWTTLVDEGIIKVIDGPHGEVPEGDPFK